MNGLQATLCETADVLENCLHGLDEFDMDHAQFADWLVTAEEKVKVTASQPLTSVPEMHLQEIEVCLQRSCSKKTKILNNLIQTGSYVSDSFH